MNAPRTSARAKGASQEYAGNLKTEGTALAFPILRAGKKEPKLYMHKNETLAESNVATICH